MPSPASPQCCTLPPTASVSQLADQQLPLGLLAGPPYNGTRVNLLPGDILLIATDGILEATNKAGAEFGLDQLERVLRENHAQALAAIAKRSTPLFPAPMLKTTIKVCCWFA